MRTGALLWAFAVAIAASAPAWSAPPCAEALRDGFVCKPASEEARRLLAARNLTGAVVIQDVETGAVVTIGSFARSDDDGPALTPASTILPLSVAKLFLDASWWAHATEFSAEDRRLRSTIVHSADDDGRQLARDLRKTAGTSLVLEDLASYGFAQCDPNQAGPDRSFWAGKVPDALVPRQACTTLDDRTDDGIWADAFSLGEANFSVSLLHLSRFMQAIGNRGIQVAPQYLLSGAAEGHRREPPAGERVLGMTGVFKLQGLMREVVESGTAQGVKGRVRGGWMLGGKTGTGPGAANPADGIFVGLLFDPQNKARYTVAIYVERGGKGGGAAAEIASDLFNYMLGL